MKSVRARRFWTGVALLFLLIGPVYQVRGQAPAAQTQTTPVVAHFHLSGELVEKPAADPFNLLGSQVTSLEDLVGRMKEAAQDDNVKAVVLTFDNMSLGFGQLEEIRAAVERLKSTGKKVYVHVGGMNTFTYSLLCSGDRLSVAPHSSLWLTGLYGESLYLKGLLDKIGVQADFMHIGDYKSAAEMLTRTEPSAPAAENINWLLDSLYGSLTDMIAQSRGKTAKEIRDLIDQGPCLAEEALAKGLIDAVETREAFLTDVRAEIGGPIEFDNRYGQEKRPQFNPANPLAILSILGELMNPPHKPQKAAVAVVYVEGTILPGYGQASPFGTSSGAFSGDIAKALETAAKDSSVKAVVMRVDSPGGSAEASEVILNAARQIQGHKPFIVSMGNVAGSGGYYVSCRADTIFADEATITASIGVVGGKLVTTDMWTKLGVNWVGYKRGANADIFTSARPFDDAQRQLFEQYMEKVYEAFKGHVAEGRGDKLHKPLDEIAGGRVYTGKQALELGLIDRIGGLQPAIEYAASKASITDYEVRVIPEPKDFLTMLMEDYSGQGENPSDISMPGEVKVNDDSPLLSQPTLVSLLDLLRKTEPQRAHALVQALQRIELIRNEGVIMMMPYDMILH
jgi:protease-4